MILCRRGGEDDVVKVVDFGLVKDIENAATDVTASAVNAITGTPLYLSPESIRTPAEVDGRSDLYSLGCVAYYLLTGSHVFDSTSFVEICGHHLHTTPRPPSDRTDRPIPTDLEQLVLRCLAKDPADRPQNARELAASLRECEAAGGWTSRDATNWWTAYRERPDTDSAAAAEASGETVETPLAGPTATAEITPEVRGAAVDDGRGRLTAR